MILSFLFCLVFFSSNSNRNPSSSPFMLWNHWELASFWRYNNLILPNSTKVSLPFKTLWPAMISSSSVSSNAEPSSSLMTFSTSAISLQLSTFLTWESSLLLFSFVSSFSRYLLLIYLVHASLYLNIFSSLVLMLMLQLPLLSLDFFWPVQNKNIELLDMFLTIKSS